MRLIKLTHKGSARGGGSGATEEVMPSQRHPKESEMWKLVVFAVHPH